MSDYPITPLAFTAVRFRDGFWSPRIATNRRTTIPLAFRRCEETGRVGLLERAAAVLRGEEPSSREKPGYPFDETDVYKVIEGAAYALSVERDAALEAYVDGLVEKIAAAQEPDGYLYPARTIDPENPHPWSGRERWESEKDLSHELYNLGHLFEAAAAWKEATGKSNLLDVALRAADMLDRTFGKGRRSIWPGHPIVEMGLARLTRVTGEARFLELAGFFLDERGPGGTGNTQAHLKVADQSEAVGHAVRAVYLYAGMADVEALSGKRRYLDALDRLWSNVAGKKLYITGGIGALHDGEAFGKDYELPNRSAYCETCAAIGNVYWNHRMFLLHGDAKYLDVLERTLYNGLISGVSLDGGSFFYPNPLESEGGYGRQPWFGCACCPGNLCRFIASVPGYAYAWRDRTLFVNLFAAGEADLVLSGGSKVRLRVKTRYPWDGDVAVMVEPEHPMDLKIALRIPGWSLDEPVPGDLYRFQDESAEKPSLCVNGRTEVVEMDGGFAVLERTWHAGDTIRLCLPMPVRRVLAHEAVEADRGRVALQRGPLVYCVEEADLEGGPVLDLVLEDGAALETDFRKDLLGGVQIIRGKGKDGRAFTAIPYFAWANRGAGRMAVWLRRA